jgi:nucleoid-associated protein
MVIHNAVLHSIEKPEDFSPSTLLLNDNKFHLSDILENFCDDLNQVYNSQSAKKIGCFLSHKQMVEASGEQVDINQSLLSSEQLLALFLKDEINFIDYTHQSMKLLKYYLDQSHLMIHGYMIFIHYTLFGHNFILMGWLHNVIGLTVDPKLSINKVNYLDLKKLDVMVRIDLSLWQNDGHSTRYISMIQDKASHQLATYFRYFIGYNDSVNTKQETSELLTAVNQYCYDNIENEEKKLEFKQKSVDFCMEQADKGLNVVLKDFSGYVAEEAVDDFMNYIQSEKYTLHNEISPNKTVVRRFNKLSGRNQQVSITINEEVLGDTVIYDENKGTLTFLELPHSLKIQLLNR